MDVLMLPSELISVSWLEKNINYKGLILLDASWFMPALKRDGEAEWRDETIPGALFFDFDKHICDKSSDLPHMMPSAALFEQSARSLGINQTSTIVVFDRLGIFSSPRVWWMFKCMGFNNIGVLDGGLPAWKAHGFAVSGGIESNVVGDVVVQYQGALICDALQVLNATENEQVEILDARPEPRFLGQVAEPRADLRSGHMPSAKNLPFADLIESGKMKGSDQLLAIYAKLIDGEKSIILSCGSGVTACILALGATLCGYQNLSVYDGSWTQWGSDRSLPVIKSESVNGN